MTHARAFLVICLAVLPLGLEAQRVTATAAREAASHWHRAHRRAILDELITLVRIPNLASDSVGIRANARLLSEMLHRRGFTTRLLEAPGSPPAVFAEQRFPGARRTVVFYAHYDGQPVRESEWRTPPWTPTLFDGRMEAGAAPQASLPDTGAGEWRLHARSASDDKGPIVAMLAALDALRSARIVPSVNLKVFLEGEEEAGSPHLVEMLRRHVSLLDADLWLFADGPVHQSRRPQVVFGARGVMGLEITAYGPARALHSGHYGNWAPNPGAMVAELLASMRATDGRITIDGFMTDVRPPSAAERRALAAMPAVERALLHELLLAQPEGGPGRLLDRIMRPTLNVRGLAAGGVGGSAANAIPTTARASIDFRLVPDQEPRRVQRLVEAHARRRGFHVVHDEPDSSTRRLHSRVLRMVWDGGYPATRTALDAPASRALLRAVDEATGVSALRVPTLGGSLPMHHFADLLRVPLVVLPIVNHDNNQHAANENLRLQNLWDGIELFAGVFARLDW